MKKTQKEIILEYLAYMNDWIPAYKIRSKETPFGWLGHQADRVARQLAQDGKILRRINNKYAEYHWKQSPEFLPSRIIETEPQNVQNNNQKLF